MVGKRELAAIAVCQECGSGHLLLGREVPCRQQDCKESGSSLSRMSR
jgi:hypothetical protein